MAAKTLNDFTLAGTAASDDFVVGFDTAVANGERKWTVATIANAVSGVMATELNNAFFNTTDVIPIANGGTGQTTAFAGLVALANGGASTGGKYLKVNAGNTALEYDTIDLSTADVTGVLPIANGGTGGSTGGATTAKAWVNFDGTTTGTWAGGASTVTRVVGSTTATITTTNAHGLTTGNSVWVLIGVVAGVYTVTVLTSNTFTITTVATTALNAIAITFQGSTIRSQYNVSSVTKNGTGDFTVNFTTAMADANYCWAIGSAAVGNNGFIIQNMASQTVNAIRFNLLYGSQIDLMNADRISLTIFGN